MLPTLSKGVPRVSFIAQKHICSLTQDMKCENSKINKLLYHIKGTSWWFALNAILNVPTNTYINKQRR